MYMKCKVCGAESGKYPLCRACNIKKDNGEIIKCSKCDNWHYANELCPEGTSTTKENKYLYEAQKTLISKSEQEFYLALKSSVPDGYCIFPQVNLASFIQKTYDSKYRTELFRNVDFLITDSEYSPKIIVEINDQTHLNGDRRERDEKVQKICEEAGIPILKLWTSYGVNPSYIKGKIDETLSKLPIERIHHFSKPEQPPKRGETKPPRASSGKKAGCYIATCVYGSYDCPEVWTLRRYRDNYLASVWYGRVFIKVYYAVSPVLVKWFGKLKWFRAFWKKALDRLTARLQNNGVENTPYDDKIWK